MTEATMARLSYLPAAAVILSLLAGLASARIEEPRYALTGLRLDGPATIPNGATRTYRLVLSTQPITRETQGALREAALTATDRVRPELLAGGVRLAAGEIEVEQLRRTGAVELTLGCHEHQVRGALTVGSPGSGAGARARSGRMGLPWFDQPATVRARVNGLESNALTVLCDG
jgi:hypothetical protein